MVVGAHGNDPGGAALDNNANNSSPSPRRRRYDRRTVLWSVTSKPRCRACGRTVRVPGGEVGVRLSSGVAGFAGLASCASVWVCPVCNGKIMARRALEIGTLVAGALAEGYTVVFATLTMRHRAGQRLRTLWAALGYGWGQVTGGKGWVLVRDGFGIEGFVRVTETTFGANGWHVHVHALLFVREQVSDEQIEVMGRKMWERWNRALTRKGIGSSLPVGSDFQRVTGDLSSGRLGEYLTKGMQAAGSIGAELTWTQSKAARSKHSTVPVWALLDLAGEGDEDAQRWWREWENASFGKRQISWSQGIRERFGLRGDEESDDEIASEELADEHATLVWITRVGWSSLIRRPALIPLVLEVAEAAGQDGLATWLGENGIEYRRA